MATNKQKLYALSEAGFRRVQEATRRVLNTPVRMQRYRRQPPVFGDARCTCITVYEIATNGSVTGGTFDLDVAVDDDGTGAGTPETLTFNWDDTAAEVQTEFETHTEISSGDIVVIGGDLPNTAVYVVFKRAGNLNRSQPLPQADATSLTGTNPEVKVSYKTNANWEAV